MQANPNRTARIAEMALGSRTLQGCSWRSVTLLVDIAAGNAADIEPEKAQQFAEEALETAIAAEIVTARGRARDARCR